VRNTALILGLALFVAATPSQARRDPLKSYFLRCHRRSVSGFQKLGKWQRHDDADHLALFGRFQRQPTPVSVAGHKVERVTKKDLSVDIGGLDDAGLAKLSA